MIVQNSRLFLTDVTITAVAPTAVFLWNEVISHKFRHMGDIGDISDKGDKGDMGDMNDIGHTGDISELGD